VPHLPKGCHITLVNLDSVSIDGLANIVLVVGDVRRMAAFADRAFDVCFSNSVIERVGTCQGVHNGFSGTLEIDLR
jgi:hypothetical protein